MVIPLCLLCVHYHPEPVDDCPCFEDAIAFMSVVMGEFLTRWCMSRYGFDDRFFVRTMPGRPSGTLPELWAWWSVAAAKLVIGKYAHRLPTVPHKVHRTNTGFAVGVLAIFAWRILAKALLHRVLPPTYRALAQRTTLPHRRFYTPATDYTNVPFSPDPSGLRAIPSVLNLPGAVAVEVDGVSTARKNVLGGAPEIKLRAGRKQDKSDITMQGFEELGGKGANVVKHYDADGE